MGRGRPSALERNPAITESITALIRIGNFPEVAAKVQGISGSAYYSWMSKGRSHKCPEPSEPEDNVVDLFAERPTCTVEGHIFREFQEAVEKARAEQESALVGLLRQASALGIVYRDHLPNCLDPRPGLSDRCQCPTRTVPPNPFLAARMLESTARERWLRVERIEHTGADGGPVAVEDVTKKLIEETDRIAKRLLGNMEPKA